MNDEHDPDKPWRSALTPEQYAVCRCSATEPPFSGKYWNHKGDGRYVCAACGTALFESDTKYDSGSGWPSFFDSIGDEAVSECPDFSHGMHRVEIQCAGCGSHLGHVFPDGPAPTGRRYCVNSLALDFRPVDKPQSPESAAPKQA